MGASAISHQTELAAKLLPDSQLFGFNQRNASLFSEKLPLVDEE
jgi:hypothetical protein